jgi:hypothetical protein
MTFLNVLLGVIHGPTAVGHLQSKHHPRGNCAHQHARESVSAGNVTHGHRSHDRHAARQQHSLDRALGGDIYAARAVWHYAFLAFPQPRGSGKLPPHFLDHGVGATPDRAKQQRGEPEREHCANY